ncbi:GntR family transcriptional regulator [soil metagenome]
MATVASDQERSDEWRQIGKSRQSLNNVVADALREAILTGKFKPGDRLPEPQLAEMFGVSRNPIREALQVLSNEGLVEISPRKGARVPLMSDEELLETIELRAELEGISARNAARHCAGAVRVSLTHLLKSGNSAQSRAEVQELQLMNDKFHTELAAAGKNRYLTEFMRSLRDRTYWLFSTNAEMRADASWTEHAKILEAVIAGDAARASRLAADHVLKVGQSLLADIKEVRTDAEQK